MSVTCWDFDDHPAVGDLVAKINAATHGRSFDLAVVLGSGWPVDFVDHSLEVIEYRDWPCFPAGQIAGHQGCLQVCMVAGWQVLIFSGRFHCYQGLSAFQVAFPVRLASALGSPRLLLTCATGGVNPDYAPGDFMLVEDHLNCLGSNPLQGLSGEIFVDLSRLYRTDFYRDLAATLPAGYGRLHRGVLAAMPGPSYETPAEIRMLRNAGADVVSMSTVPEAIMARYLGMEVTALALIANPAAGVVKRPISHAEVLACGQSSAAGAKTLLRQMITLWQRG